MTITDPMRLTPGYRTLVERAIAKAEQRGVTPTESVAVTLGISREMADDLIARVTR